MIRFNTLFSILLAVLVFTSVSIGQRETLRPAEDYNPAALQAPELIQTGKIIGSSSDHINSYYEEGFEAVTFPPNGWQVINVLGTNTWVRSTSYFRSGVASAYISYNSTGGEDWLITPKWTITAGDSLVFWARKVFSSSYPPDYLEVRLSTTDSAIASFTVTLLSQDVNALVYNEWNRIAIAMNAYAGQSVFLALKHYDTDGNGVYVDDLVLGVPPPNDVGMFSIDITTPMLPGTVTPTATVKNFGSAAQTFPVTLTITPGTYTSTKTVTSLAPGTTAQVTFDNWNATLGSYTATSTTQLAGDVNPSNNQLTKNLEVTSASWTVGANIPVTTYMGTGAAFARGDTGWVFSSGGNSTNKTEVSKYNINTNTWTACAPIPVPRVVTSSAVAMGKLYIIGGSDGAATPAYQSTVYQYDIDANSWTTVAALPGIRGWGKALTYQDSLIYYAGGYNGTTYLTEVLLYNVNTNTWRQCTPLPVGVFGGAFAVYGNILVWVGGATSPGIVATTYVGTINQTDRSQITWTTGLAYPGGLRFRWDAAPWGTKGIIVTGGSNSTTWSGSNLTYYYDPVGNTWTMLPNKITASLGSSVGSFQRLNGDIKFVCASGYNGTAAMTATEIFADNFPIPVELVSFSGSADHNSVTLSWITATEINNAGFEVERKSTGEFQSIAYVKGHGSTTEINNYVYTDKNLESGTYVYRLKQIDFDGTSTYSKEVKVEVSQPVTYSLSQNYPNPFNPSTIISYSIPVKGFVTLKVYDALGSEVAELVNSEQEIGKYEVNFTASGLSSGIYFYKLVSGDFVQTNKMMLLK